jgi:hypothetical protein
MSADLAKRYVVEADQVMNIHWAKPDTSRTTWSLTHDVHWSRRRFRIGQGEACVAKQLREITRIYTFAAYNSLLAHLKSVSYQQLTEDHRSALVLHALDSWWDASYSSASLEDRTATLAYLLIHVAKPETLFSHARYGRTRFFNFNLYSEKMTTNALLYLQSYRGYSCAQPKTHGN